MTKERKKSLNIKVLLTNVFMVVSVIAIASILTLVAMGYRLEGGELTQYGLLQVISTPSGAGVEIDGERADTTEMSKMLSDGNHSLVVTKPGYDTWRGNVNVSSGLLSRVDWVRLFPVERVIETAKGYVDMSFVSMIPTRSGILVGRSGATWTTIENLDGRTVTTRDIDVPEWVAGKEISVRRWNKNGDRLFVRVGEEWGMIDTKVATASVNLSQKYSMKFDDIAIVDDAGSRVYALENGNIRIVDIQHENLSDVKVSGVTSISGDSAVVGYTQTQAVGQVAGVFREDERAVEEMFEVESGGVTIRTWRYWGDDIVVGVVGGKLLVMRGEVYGEMKEIAAIELGDAELGTMGVSPSGRFLVAGGRVVDVTNGNVYEARAGRWMDDFLMYEIVEGKLVVWDFSGENEREIGVAGAGEVMVSRENGWLYYVGPEGGKIMRERL